MQIKHNKILFIIYSILFLAVFAQSNNTPLLISRDNWIYDDTNTTRSGLPSNLKFLKYYDSLPDQIAIKILDKRDLSQMEGKHIYVGYGTVNPKGRNCRIFTPEYTGMDHNVTICLPWWRIEREYEMSSNPINDIGNFLCSIPKPKPPIMVSVCKEWEDSGDYTFPGGKVTCTSYYDRLTSADCWDNPKQPQCFKDNCSEYIKNNCEDKGTMMGETTTLTTAVLSAAQISPTQTKVDLVTHQYECPAGSMIPFTHCLEKKSVLMYPYKCSPRTSSQYDDSKYIYCDENKPQYDTSGNIIGFLGQCPDGRQVMCDANGFSQTTNKCIEPIMRTFTYDNTRETIDERGYHDYSVDVISGETDEYAARENCIRTNTVDSSREKIITAHIVGNGNLDDDIWIFRHSADGSKIKIYCNMQHNEDYNSSKNYDGTVYQCIDNDGHYSFNKNIEINKHDIVTVQEATENENSFHDGYFPTGRTHYCSTRVTIDNVLVAPRAEGKLFPFFSGGGDCHGMDGILPIWENTLGTLSILFPYSGSYKLYFFHNDLLLTTYSINQQDFQDIVAGGNIQLHLANQIAFSPTFNPSDTNTTCLNDDWAEIGGGVHGGKNSLTGSTCQIPNDNYVKTHAITKVIVQDLLTGTSTYIPLVYPLAYPNRIFLSKLKLYETRKYRCYDPFPNH